MIEGDAGSTQAAQAAAPSSPAYRRYVLGVLLVVSTLNYLDRQIINILVEPIKRDLHLTDWQLGMITGLSFTILYSTMAIPIARLADRFNRPWIIGASLAIWSAFTSASGFAYSFVQMFLARVGVGIGEAGGSPPAHSLISDYTTPANRASALAVFSLGNPLGVLLGLGAGGLVAEAVGWRAAFVIAAAPGLLLAVLIVLTIKEPRKEMGRVAAATPPVSLAQAIRELRGKPSFWWLTAGAGCAAFVISAHGAFYGSYFIRQYGPQLASLSTGIGALGVAGLILGVVRGISGIFGTMAGGYMTDRAVARDGRGYCTIPAVFMFLSAPGFASVMLAPNLMAASVLLVIPGFLGAAILAPTFAAVQTMVTPGSRATAAAIIFFLLNMVGGMGPVVVGLISDVLARDMDRSASLSAGMLWVCPVMLLSGLCYWMGRRTIIADLVTA